VLGVKQAHTDLAREVELGWAIHASDKQETLRDLNSADSRRYHLKRNRRQPITTPITDSASPPSENAITQPLQMM